jgi:hypothetical protein
MLILFSHKIIAEKSEKTHKSAETLRYAGTELRENFSTLFPQRFCG